MTVEPVIFRLGSLEVSGFGLLVLAGFIAGAWVIRRELLRRGLAGNYAGEFFIAAAIGGLLGAKLWYAALFRDPSAFFERSGMVWWRGLIGGALGAGWLFGVYLALAGAERFLVELLRAKDDRFFAGLTLAQMTAILAVLLGLLLMRRWTRPDPAVEEAAAKALGGRAGRSSRIG